MAKKKKSTLAPSRPISAYLAFCNKMRTERQDDIAMIPVKDQAKKFGEWWRELSEEEKKPYYDEYKVQLELYHSDRKAYELTDAYKQELAEKELAKAEANAKPKKRKAPRALSAYNVFTSEEYEKIKNSGEKAAFGSMASVLSERWKMLSKEKKEEYQKLAEERTLKLREQENKGNSK
ncbi:Intrastrand cross-link recognition protein [Astathelohania contejeani]|uniref:Intrastrand cross-link recognition protein n=1 Tax=Astathelohania contejeani TaxID=164912 RepID=A0ABQ7HWM4_9MICR|nr:Intrastrand cross-link recognition protein [Thelohania contejeani]